MCQNPHNWINNILLFIRLKFIYFKNLFSEKRFAFKIIVCLSFLFKKNQFQIGQRIRMS